MDAQILAEMNNMRIRIDERDGKLANQSGVITKLEQSRRDLRKDKARLLAVAREARIYRMGHSCKHRQCRDEAKLLAALAAVEDLL